MLFLKWFHCKVAFWRYVYVLCARWIIFKLCDWFQNPFYVVPSKLTVNLEYMLWKITKQQSAGNRSIIYLRPSVLIIVGDFNVRIAIISVLLPSALLESQFMTNNYVQWQSKSTLCDKKMISIFFLDVRTSPLPGETEIS